MEETPESNSTSSDGAVEAAPNGVDDGNHSSLPLQQHPEGTAPEDRDDIYSESDVSMEIESDDETKAIPGDPGTLPGSDASNEATSSRQKRRHPDDSGRKRKKARKLAKAEDEGPSNPSSTQQLSDTAALQETPSQPPSSDKLLSPEIWCHVFSFTEPRTLGRLLRVNKLFNSLLDPSSKHLQPITSQSSSAAKPLTADAIWKLSRTRFCSNMPSPLQGRSELDMWRLLLSRNCQFCSKAGSGSHLNLEGSMIMWSFGIRSCASCLSDRTMKEIDLLLSSSFPSVLAQALPFALVTNELRPVSSIAVQNGLVPPDVQVTKLFLKSDIEKITREFFEAKALGAAAAAEWTKGLETRGRNVRIDSARWERWESQGGLPKLHSSASSRPSSQRGDQATSSGRYTPASGSNSNCDSSRQSSSGPPPPSARTQEGAAKLKARRRAEIERRASLLDPPIPGNVLVHIPSFQAAIQIPVLLDDAAWELLKPRLISQRQDAERKAQEAAESSDVVASGMSDEDWEAIQAPIRAKLAEHADAVISDQWDDGKSVGEDNCAQFAAEVILATRGKFHASLVQEAIAARNEGRSPAQSAGLSNKISLETMKWLFDYRIKPITEKFRKEIFLCNGCKGPIQKWYSFEGVLQHYAAKHTNALSHGSVVVYWRAEWPERPPFHPEPQKRILDAQHAAYAQPQAGGPGQYGHGYYSQAYPQVPTPGFSAPPVFQPGPTPYGHQPAYPAAVPYAPAPYAPPSTYYQPYGVASVEHPSPQPAFPPTGPATGNPYVSPPPLAAAPGIHHPPGAYGGYNYGAYGANAQAPPAMVSPVGYTQDYPTQLNSIAQVSRDVQSRLAHVKDLPGNVKVYVTIHHVAKAFRARFSESPPLSMFIEGLSNNKDMRRVRNVNGLVCKACALGFDPGSLSDRRDFSLPQLVNHFQKVHVEQAEQQGRRVLDWTTDMVLLPASSVLSELQQSIAGNKKADLVREALAQLPQEGAPVTNSGAGLGISSGSARPPGQPPFGEQYFSRPADDHNKYYGPPHGNGGHPYRHDVPDVKEAEGAIRHRGDESWARNRPDDYASPIVGPQPPAAKPSVPVADYRDSGESSPRGGFVQYSRPAMPPQDGHGRGYDSRELADDRNSGFNSRYVEQPRPVPRDPGPPPGYAREACAYDGGPSGIRRTPDRNAGYGEPGQVRSRSRSPLAYSRQPGTQYPGYYRERSPRMRPAERPYPPEFHSQRPMDHDQYGPPNRGEYFRTLEEARRADPGRNFPHGFEIVRVKEPSGEYYIRRPIRPEHGPGFEPPADHARGPEWYGNGRREADARYAPPESEYRPRQPSLGPAYRQPPSHGYDERMHGFEPGPPQPMRSHGRRPFEQLPERAPGPDPSYAEEYDPRFPAAPPAGGPRQVRY